MDPADRTNTGRQGECAARVPAGGRDGGWRRRRPQYRKANGPAGPAGQGTTRTTRHPRPARLEAGHERDHEPDTCRRVAAVRTHAGCEGHGRDAA